MAEAPRFQHEATPEQLAEAFEREKVALLDAYEKSGPVARRITLLTALRIADGAPFGDFPHGRDYEREALEESIDLNNYLLRMWLGKKASLTSLEDELGALRRDVRRCDAPHCQLRAREGALDADRGLTQYRGEVARG